MSKRGIIYHEDRLVQHIRRADGSVTFHGKRVGRDCPMTRDEIREYVRYGAVKAVALIKNSRGIGLREAVNVLNAARGENMRNSLGYLNSRLIMRHG